MNLNDETFRKGPLESRKSALDRGFVDQLRGKSLEQLGRTQLPSGVFDREAVDAFNAARSNATRARQPVFSNTSSLDPVGVIGIVVVVLAFPALAFLWEHRIAAGVLVAFLLVGAYFYRDVSEHYAGKRADRIRSEANSASRALVDGKRGPSKFFMVRVQDDMIDDDASGKIDEESLRRAEALLVAFIKKNKNNHTEAAWMKMVEELRASGDPLAEQMATWGSLEKTPSA